MQMEIRNDAASNSEEYLTDKRSVPFTVFYLRKSTLILSLRVSYFTQSTGGAKYLTLDLLI